MGALIRRYRVPVAAWCAVALVLVVVQHLAVQSKTGAAPFAPWEGLRPFLAGWVQFDGWEYVSIAVDGYWYAPDARAPVVFFPLYPLVVRGVVGVTGWDAVLAAVAVSAAAGLAAAMLLWDWLGRHGLAGSARATALAVALLYPYGWFLYGPVYADSLFLALVLGAFAAADRRRYLLAGVVGALATAARPTGLALVPGLLLVGLVAEGFLRVPDEPRGLVARWRLPVQVDRSRWRPVLAAPLLAVAGIAAYAAYLQARFGDGLVFLTDQAQYQGSGITTLLKAGLVYDLIHWEDPIYTLTAAAQALVVVGVAVAVPAVGRRFGWGYGAYVAALVLIPTLISRDYVGTGRYLLAAFPVAAVAGSLLDERPRLRAACLGAAAVALVAMAYGFGRSRLLS